jgi:hypothetical protein
MLDKDATFTVDLDTLAFVHDQLNDIHATLTSSTTNQYSADEIGDDGLHNDIDNFFGDWSNYWSAMEQNISNVLGLLAQAIDAYQETDDAIGSAANGVTNQLAPVAPPHQGGAQ